MYKYLFFFFKLKVLAFSFILLGILFFCRNAFALGPNSIVEDDFESYTVGVKNLADQSDWVNIAFDDLSVVDVGCPDDDKCVQPTIDGAYDYYLGEPHSTGAFFLDFNFSTTTLSSLGTSIYLSSDSANTDYLRLRIGWGNLSEHYLLLNGSDQVGDQLYALIDYRIEVMWSKEDNYFKARIIRLPLNENTWSPWVSSTYGMTGVPKYFFIYSNQQSTGSIRLDEIQSASLYDTTSQYTGWANNFRPDSVLYSSGFDCYINNTCYLPISYSEDDVGDIVYLISDTGDPETSDILTYTILADNSNRVVYLLVPAESSPKTAYYCVYNGSTDDIFCGIKINWLGGLAGDGVSTTTPNLIYSLFQEDPCEGVATTTLIGEIDCGFRSLASWLIKPSENSYSALQNTLNAVANNFPFSVYNSIKDTLSESATSTATTTPAISLGALSGGKFDVDLPISWSGMSVAGEIVYDMITYVIWFFVFLYFIGRIIIHSHKTA